MRVNPSHDSITPLTELALQAPVAMAVHEMVYDTDGKAVDYRFLEVNKAFARHTGLVIDDLVGKRVSAVLPGIEQAGFIERYAQVVATGEADDFEMFSPPLDRHYRIHAFKVGPDRFATLFTDITEHARAARQHDSDLEEAQHLYKALVENQTDLVVKVDPAGRFEFVSPSYCTLFGKSSEDLIGKKFMPLVHPDDQAATVKAMRALHAEPHCCTFQQRAKTVQGWRWLEWSDTGIVDDVGNLIAVIGVGRDVTDKIDAAKQRERLASQLEEAQQIANAGSWDYDPASDLLTWSPQAYRIFGLVPGQFGGTYEAFLSHVYEGDRARIMAAFEESLTAPGQIYDLEHRIKRADTGEIRWVHEQCRHVHDAAGRVVRSIGVVQDITERRQAENERKRLIAALEQTAEAIIVTNAHGVIEYVNTAFEKNTGYRRDEVIGRNPRLLKSGRHDTSFYKDLWETITGGMVWKGRIINRRKNGELFTEQATISPVFNENSQLAHFVAAKCDISQQLAREAELQQAQKMESVARLASGVAHDFNNVLQVIMGSAQLLELDLPQDSPGYKDVLCIIEAARRAKDMTGQLLTFARKAPQKAEQLDPNEELEKMEDMLRRLLGAQVNMVWNRGESVWPVWLDKGQLSQIIVNLCVNARDAMDRNGVIHISTANAVNVLPKPNGEEAVVSGDFVCVSVQDDGQGMDAHTLACLWDPFFTTKDPGKGTGLGLPTVHGIVRAAGGFIEVESECGKGSTFSVYLPRFDERGTGSTAAVQAVTLSGNVYRLLVVDDDVGVLKQTARILTTRGHAVRSYSSPAAALEWIEHTDDLPELVLTDIAMPEIDGVRLAGQIQGRYPRIKVLYMSGYTPEHLKAEVLRDNGSNFIQKPFAVDDLISKIESIMK